VSEYFHPPPHSLYDHDAKSAIQKQLHSGKASSSERLRIPKTSNNVAVFGKIFNCGNYVFLKNFRKTYDLLFREKK